MRSLRLVCFQKSMEHIAPIRQTLSTVHLQRAKKRERGN
ncbi:hypothetical protein TSMEX_007727 [Taenia solium]|eukprot:TsM_000178200 transcript=TsM_000178200 gene=TsM_000178200